MLIKISLSLNILLKSIIYPHLLSLGYIGGTVNPLLFLMIISVCILFIKHVMKDIFVSEDAGSQKPRKEYFDYCFRRMPGILPQEMILVGDSLSSDILGGNQAGTDTCWYNPAGLPGREDIRPDYEIRDLRELEGIL